MAGRNSPFNPHTSSTPVPSEYGSDFSEEDQDMKRESRVLNELLDTERSFLNDMEVLRHVSA